MKNKKTQPRIIAGKYKGISLDVPSSARPMTERIKQSVFDLISDFIDESTVLDLFAGAGNLGIEALSRGARSCTFIELDEQAAIIIRANLSKLRPNTPDAKVVETKSEKFLRETVRTENKFDLIFADPPFPIAHKFDFKLATKALSEEGLLVYRVPKEVKLAPTIEPAHVQTYGESTVYFFR